MTAFLQQQAFTVIDIQDDTIIVEFGNNKNCRIPMQKNSVVEVEKAQSAE